MNESTEWDKEPCYKYRLRESQRRIGSPLIVLTYSAANASGFHRWRCAPARPWCGWLRLPPWIFLPLLLTVVKSHDSAIQASLMALGLASVGFSYPNNCFRTRKTYVLEWKRSIRLVMSQICYIFVAKLKKKRDRGQVGVPQRIRRSASGLFWENSNCHKWPAIKRKKIYFNRWRSARDRSASCILIFF